MWTNAHTLGGQKRENRGRSLANRVLTQNPTCSNRYSYAIWRLFKSRKSSPCHGSYIWPINHGMPICHFSVLIKNYPGVTQCRFFYFSNEVIYPYIYRTFNKLTSLYGWKNSKTHQLYLKYPNFALNDKERILQHRKHITWIKINICAQLKYFLMHGSLLLSFAALTSFCLRSGLLLSIRTWPAQIFIYFSMKAHSTFFKIK